MDNIQNWQTLINLLQNRNGIFTKLLSKIMKSIIKYRKNNYDFTLLNVDNKHIGDFMTFKYIYYQLLIETDITDIFQSIPTDDGKKSIMFHLVGIGKRIKLFFGSTNKIIFEENDNLISIDKTISDFLSKVPLLETDLYFGKKPITYYKFQELPNIHIIEYIESFNVIPILFDQATPSTYNLDKFESNIIIDDSIIFTLCSKESLFTSYNIRSVRNYQTINQYMESKDIFENYLNNKIILISQTDYHTVADVFDKIAGETEKILFNNLIRKIKIIPDIFNKRFKNIKHNESIILSIAENEYATVITGNKRFYKKIKNTYSEIPTKIFPTLKLTELCQF